MASGQRSRPVQVYRDMSELVAKTKFYWASVAHAEPEVVEVVVENGQRVAYTCGCEDPFFLDEPNCQLVLGRHVTEVIGGKVWELFDPERPLALTRPSGRKKSAAAMKAAQTAYEKSGPHRWRGPR